TPRLYGRPSVSALLSASPVSDLVTEILAFYERRFGLVYPFEQRACVFLPGYGSQGTCSPGRLMLHERVLRASVDDAFRRYVLWVLAHEVAHTWFGCVFDVPRPEDHWLYEGVATYLCHRTMDEIAPELHPWAGFHILQEAEADDADTGPDAHAVTEVLPGDALHGLGPHIYVKPAAAIRQLETLIGTDAVDSGLKRFVADRAWCEATTA